MKKLLYLLFALSLALTIVPVPAFAQISGGNAPGISGGNTSGISGGNAAYTIRDPLGNKNFCQLIKALLDIVLAIGVPVAVLFLVWSGFKFIVARGNPTELGIARKNFMYVIIGMAVFLGAWTLAGIIASTVQSLGTSGNIQFCSK